MSQFTEQDSNKMGVPLPLLQKWETVMTTLWRYFVAYANSENHVKLKNEKNLIKFQLKDGHKFEIATYIYNKDYLSLSIKIEGNDDFEVTINNIDEFGVDGIVKTVSTILTYAENVKQ